MLCHTQSHADDTASRFTFVGVRSIDCSRWLMAPAGVRAGVRTNLQHDPRSYLFEVALHHTLLMGFCFAKVLPCKIKRQLVLCIQQYSTIELIACKVGRRPVLPNWWSQPPRHRHSKRLKGGVSAGYGCDFTGFNDHYWLSNRRGPATSGCARSHAVTVAAF